MSSLPSSAVTDHKAAAEKALLKSHDDKFKEILVAAMQKIRDVKYYEGCDTKTYDVDSPFGKVTLCTVGAEKQVVITGTVLPVCATDNSEDICKAAGFSRFTHDCFFAPGLVNACSCWRVYLK